MVDPMVLRARIAKLKTHLWIWTSGGARSKGRAERKKARICRPLSCSSGPKALWRCARVLGFVLAPFAMGCGQPTPPSNAPSMQPVGRASVSSDWPTYGHDTSRTSYNPGETTLSSGNVAQLVQIWRQDLGMGGAPTSGTPTVASGRVFVGSSVASGPDFFAFDATSGNPLWKTSLNYVANCELVGIGSTSAVDGNVVAVGGADGAYYGLDVTTGAILWRNATNDGSSTFAWSSPLIFNGRVYVGEASACDNPVVRGEVRSLDENTGALLADQFFVPPGAIGAGVWNSPSLAPGGSSVFVATGEDDGTHGTTEQAVVSLDPVTLSITGASKQGVVGQDLDFASTPVVFHDSSGRVLVGANHKSGAFYAFAANNVSAGPVWQQQLGAVIGMMAGYDPSLGDGGTLFIVGTDPGGSPELHAVDPATGNDRWARASIGQLGGNMAIANGLIFLNTGPTGLKILDETTGKTIQAFTPPGAGSIYSGVAVAGGRVYWISGQFLNAWGLPPGVAGMPPTQ
jgi:outer membrane protein assembly factor BamB